jgi:hypothetical protein
MSPEKRGGAFDWDAVRSDKSYPTGYYNAVVDEVVINHTSNGNKQYAFTCHLDAPDDFKGLPYYERITVGTEDDPDADDPKTWATNFGCGRFKGFMEACGVKLKGLPDDIVKSSEGQSLCLKLGQKTQTKGEYAGEIQQTSRFYKVGDREPGLIGVEDTPRRAKPASTPVAAKANGAAHDDDDEVLDDEPPRRRATADDDRPRRRA